MGGPQTMKHSGETETGTPSRPQYCSGCGAALQSDSPSQPGYSPPSAKERDNPVCQRCFRIKNYNEAADVALDPDEFLNIISHIAATDSLVVHIVDIFDFEGSVISGLKRFIGSNPVILVVNKLDLLPKALNPNRIVNWIKRQAKEHGLKALDVILCSAKKNIGFERVIEAIGEHR